MIHEEKFRISRRPYAIDPTGLRTSQIKDATHPSHWVHVPAVWFRRRKGLTVACLGHLWDLMREPLPVDAREAVERMTDGRYGGRCEGRWDGHGYWGAEGPEDAAAHMAVLRPMLENYPAVPPGFDGWYRFETDQQRRIAAGGAAA